MLTPEEAIVTKKETAEAVRAARQRPGLTWAQIAEAVGRPVAWTTTALDVARVPDPAGDRVVVTLDGMFLPYQWE